MSQLDTSDPKWDKPDRPEGPQLLAMTASEHKEGRSGYRYATVTYTIVNADSPFHGYELRFQFLGLEEKAHKWLVKMLRAMAPGEQILFDPHDEDKFKELFHLKPFVADVEHYKDDYGDKSRIDPRSIREPHMGEFRVQLPEDPEPKEAISDDDIPFDDGAFF